MGDDKAPVTVIEYASMTCPHCAHFQETTFPELKKRYIDTGKVRYIFREFPLDNLAAAAFMLARCAGKDDKNKYFALIDTLFRQQRQWAVEKPIPPLLAIAKQAGFTEKTFNACLANQKVLDGIESVRMRAVDKFKVQSTPTFFINGTSTRRLDDRGHGQGDRPLSQGLIRAFRPLPVAPGALRREFLRPARRKVWKTTPASARLLPLRARRFILRGRCGTGHQARAKPRNGLLNCSMQNLMERRVYPALRMIPNSRRRRSLRKVMRQQEDEALTYEAHAAAPARLQVVRRTDRFPIEPGLPAWSDQTAAASRTWSKRCAG